MKYLRFPQNWPECKNDSEALNLMKILNKIVKESLQNSDCVMPCKAMKFKVSGNYYSRNAFEAWQDYDPEYYYLYVRYLVQRYKLLDPFFCNHVRRRKCS